MRSTTKLVMNLLFLTNFLFAGNAAAKEGSNPSAEQKKLLSLGFKKIVYEQINTLAPLTEEEKRRGYLLFVRDWMEMIYPNTIPQRKEIDNKEISLFASLGEYEPAAFGIHPLKDLKNIEVIASDLTGGTNTISKENIKIRVTRYMNERMSGKTRTAGDYTYYLAGGSWSKTYMLIPKVLDDYSKFSIKKGQTKQIWLTFKIPENSKPGNYQGSVLFKPENSKEESLNIKLKVLPIKLKKSPRIEGMYWRTKPYYPQNRKKQLLDMAEHGIRAVVIPNSPQLKKEKGKVVLDFSLMDELVKEIKQAGLDGYIPLSGSYRLAKRFLSANTSVDMKFDDLYKYIIEQTLKHAKQKNWPAILFYPVDEIGNSAERRKDFKGYGKLIKEVPGAKVYCTVNNFDAGVECEKYIDFWCTNIHFTEQQEKYVLNKGKTYMRYGNAYNYNPRISRTASGFGFWKKPAVAMYYWHYQSITGSHHDALDGRGRDHMVAFPSPDGPIPTIDWEAIMEGIDDLNYIATLETLMEKAKRQGKQNLTKEGKRILNEILTCDTTYDPAWLGNQYDLKGIPTAKYHEFRWRMANEIVKLQKSL